MSFSCKKVHSLCRWYNFFMTQFLDSLNCTTSSNIITCCLVFSPVHNQLIPSLIFFPSNSFIQSTYTHEIYAHNKGTQRRFTNVFKKYIHVFFHKKMFSSPQTQFSQEIFEMVLIFFNIFWHLLAHYFTLLFSLTAFNFHLTALKYVLKFCYCEWFLTLSCFINWSKWKVKLNQVLQQLIQRSFQKDLF